MKIEVVGHARRNLCRDGRRSDPSRTTPRFQKRRLALAGGSLYGYLHLGFAGLVFFASSLPVRIAVPLGKLFGGPDLAPESSRPPPDVRGSEVRQDDLVRASTSSRFASARSG